jgi:outer membrane lipoprotein
MMRSASRFFALWVGCALMLGCATSFDIGGAAINITPLQATRDTAAVHGKLVAWGGVVVETKNLAERTRIEVLGYPLDRRNRPDVDAMPTGRFLVDYPGFLDPVNFASGRLVTAVGQIAGTLPGTVGDAHYLYPVIETSRVFLWPTPQQEASQPQFHFGVGIGITR